MEMLINDISNLKRILLFALCIIQAYEHCIKWNAIQYTERTSCKIVSLWAKDSMFQWSNAGWSPSWLLPVHCNYTEIENGIQWPGTVEVQVKMSYVLIRTVHAECVCARCVCTSMCEWERVNAIKNTDIKMCAKCRLNSSKTWLDQNSMMLYYLCNNKIYTELFLVFGRIIYF